MRVVGGGIWGGKSVWGPGLGADLGPVLMRPPHGVHHCCAQFSGQEARANLLQMQARALGHGVVEPLIPTHARTHSPQMLLTSAKDIPPCSSAGGPCSTGKGVARPGDTSVASSDLDTGMAGWIVGWISSAPQVMEGRGRHAR